ncbi:GNAT family N-acetyltransferase [Shewanella sp. UCD-KL21]|uniref:GNAT family N-acetyltransferase n=1 Tax=Shewanella sp. UCD-KL21 TaxID=1917164 RepID=UPI000970ADE1|nr:GNAT family N-acetyltransferase [Shewanella sp. UCD-KL21]
MSIIPITERLWPAIYDLQCQVYSEIEPETMEVLRSKWLHSPHACFAYCSNQTENADSPLSSSAPIQAYLLAHELAGAEAPKLHQPLSSTHTAASGSKSKQGSAIRLFLHDLAVSKDVKGMGVGKLMVAHLIALATAKGYKEVLLIAIQGSVPFWQKQGFELDLEVSELQAAAIEASYGAGAKAMRKKLSFNR